LQSQTSSNLTDDGNIQAVKLEVAIIIFKGRIVGRRADDDFTLLLDSGPDGVGLLCGARCCRRRLISS